MPKQGVERKGKAGRKMTVFIGWSGSGGKEIAERMKMFLQEFFGPRIDVTFSEEIPAGDVWFSTLTRMLQEAHYGLLCLVPQSEPAWLLYEAGVLSQTTLSTLKGNQGPHIAPILFGVNGETFRKFGPLAYYQKYSFNSEVIGKILGNMNDVSLAMAEAQTSPAHGYRAPSALTQTQFDTQWEKLYETFERDILRLMKANDLELHLEPFRGAAMGTRRALFHLGETLVNALRADTAAPDKWRDTFRNFQNTLEDAILEEGTTVELKPLQKDAIELKNLL